MTRANPILLISDRADHNMRSSVKVNPRAANPRANLPAVYERLARSVLSARTYLRCDMSYWHIAYSQLMWGCGRMQPRRKGADM